MATSFARPLKCTVKYDSNFNRVYTGVYQVIADLYDGPNTVLAAVGLPNWGQSFYWGLDTDVWAFANGSSANPTDRVMYEGRDCWVWEVTVTWSTVPATRTPSYRNNPLDEPAELSGSFVGSTKPVYRDSTDLLIANSAGEPYNPPPEINSGIETFNIAFNTPTISIPLRAGMIGKVNSHDIWGLDPRQLLLNQWRYQILYAGSFPFVRNFLEFLINFNKTPSTSCTGMADEYGWYTTFPNIGIAPLSVASDKDTRRHKKDDMDQPLTSPVILKCDGTQGTTETWNVFAVEREADFNTIPGLPLTLPSVFVP